MQWFDTPITRADGVTLYGRDIGGRPIVQPRRPGLGAVVLMHGYEVQRGGDQVVAIYPDRSAVFAELCGSEWRGYRRPAGEWAHEWPADPSAVAEAFRAAGLAPAAMRSQSTVDRWDKVTPTVRNQVKRWLLALLRGEGGAGLYLYGTPGSGKSTTIKALAAEARAAGLAVCAIDVRQFGTDLRNSYGGKGSTSIAIAETIDQAKRANLCLLDDLFAGGKKDADAELDGIFDARLAAGLPTVIADNASPAQWAGMGLHERVASRLSALQPVEFPRVDHRRKQRANLEG
jgi:hypothetical protein